MTSFKDLDVWNKGIDFVAEISGFTQIPQIKGADIEGYALWVMGYALCVMRYGLWVKR
jgi:hypothetical protein